MRERGVEAMRLWTVVIVEGGNDWIEPRYEFIYPDSVADAVQRIARIRKNRPRARFRLAGPPDMSDAEEAEALKALLVGDLLQPPALLPRTRR